MFNFREKLDGLLKDSNQNYHTETEKFIKGLVSYLNELKPVSQKSLSSIGFAYNCINGEGYITINTNEHTVFYAECYKPKIAKRVFKDFKNIIKQIGYTLNLINSYAYDFIL